MGKVIIQDMTTKNPITLIGYESGVCYGSDVTNDEKNYKRGLENINSGHGRTLEFPQVYMILDGYSARLGREFYTHIAGGPTRLQASTRYIDYDHFEFITPPSIKDNAYTNWRYDKCMQEIISCYEQLENLGIPKEDIANILPLGMTTKIVCRTNLRNLIDMSHQRLCNRAYWEFRDLMHDLMNALSEYSEEWDYIVKNYMVPKCVYLGSCPETHSCKADKNG
jgi:thymidylate synthase (FAD)